MPRLRSRCFLVLAAAMQLAVCGVSRAQSAPASDYARRRTAVIGQLDRRLLLTPSALSYMTDDQPGFKQATDFQYFTGLSDVVGAVLAIDGAAQRVVLFVQPSNPVLTRWQPAADAASARLVGVHDVLPIDSLPRWLAGRWSNWGAIAVSPTDARGAIRAPLPMANSVVRWSNYLAQLGYSGKVESAIPLTRPLRAIKDSTELRILERVADLSGRAMLAGMQALAPGRMQRMVESRVVSTCVEGGGVHSFWPWAMSGPHAVYTDLFDAFVDYESHNRAMQAGELVRVDVGCRFAQYMGDVWRTAPVNGRFDPGQREAWNLFIAGYRAGLAEVRDGARVGDVFAAALARVRALQPTMRTAEGKRAAAILLSPTGTEAWEMHGVGLDDAEGNMSELRAGMVVAYELMFAVRGNGYYLEDLVHVLPGGARVLTAGLPYTAEEIERAMARRR
jgi:Xaa-Pro aminopeptidase